MAGMFRQLVLVVPCHNESRRLAPQAFLQLVAANRQVKLLFVDDGSTDTTPAILADIVSGGASRISVLTMPRNVGKAEAVRQGVLSALQDEPELVGYWDADLSTPLSELQQFLDELEFNPAVDIVMGARVNMLGRHIDRRPLRHYAGRLFATAASLALRIAVYDTQCGAKVFRANAPVRQAFAEPFRSRWVMDVEILSRYLAATGRADVSSRIHEVPLKSWMDVPGSKLGLAPSVRALWDLGGIWRRSRQN